MNLLTRMRAAAAAVTLTAVLAGAGNAVAETNVVVGYQLIVGPFLTAIADGSFDRLFCQHFAQKIARTRLAQRTAIDLFNPILPPETPLARKELWFSADLCAAAAR